MNKKKLPVVLTGNEAESLLNQINVKCKTGLRNYCILALQFNTGLRISEVIGKENTLNGGIRLNDINLTTGEINVKNGKGGRDRNVWINGKVMARLGEWMKIRPESNNDLLFTTLQGAKIKNTYMRKLVKRLSRKAGIKKKICTHTLRHTFATSFYKKTKDLRTLQKILGHSRVQTTEIYTHIFDEDVKNGMISFSI